MRRTLAAAAFGLFVLGGLVAGSIGLEALATRSDPPARTALPASLPTPVPATPVVAHITPPPTPLPDAATPTPSVVAQAASAPSATWLYVVDGNLWETRDGTAVQLTQSGGIGQPALTDGGLAYVERTRNASDIWLASADAAPRPLTHDTSTSVSLNHWATQPVYVPSAQRLYVLGDFNKATTGFGNLAVWQVGLRQEQPVQITRPPAYGGGDQDVTFNPTDPRQIIFTRYMYVETTLVEQLEWLDVARDTLIALTQPEQAARQAVYAPDGLQVAFVQRSAGQQENLYVAQVNVTAGRAQVESPVQVVSGVISNPAWSPDGSALAYVTLTDHGFQLCSIDVQLSSDGTETFGAPRQLTSGASLDATSRPVYLTREQADAVRDWLAAGGV